VVVRMSEREHRLRIREGKDVDVLLRFRARGTTFILIRIVYRQIKGVETKEISKK